MGNGTPIDKKQYKTWVSSYITHLVGDKITPQSPNIDSNLRKLPLNSWHECLITSHGLCRCVINCPCPKRNANPCQYNRSGILEYSVGLVTMLAFINTTMS